MLLGRDRRGHEIEHGPELAWSERPQDFAQPPEEQRQAEALWKGDHARCNKAAQALARRATKVRLRQRAKRADQVPIGHTAGTGRFAGQAAQAAVNVQLGALPGQLALKHFFH